MLVGREVAPHATVLATTSIFYIMECLGRLALLLHGAWSAVLR